MKNNKIVIGLLGVIAVALIVNAVLLSGNGKAGDVDPKGPKAAFERKAASTAAEARQNAYDAIAATNPVPTERPTQIELERAAQTTTRQESAPSGPLTSIKFDNNSHDFGTIYQDSENKKIFRFTNTGKEPLIIENAKGSCGCTVPKYPKEPIAPGKTGEIEVVYRPGKQKDFQTKNITITANTDPANTMLTISANVLEVK
jgi:hypothetical protein